MTVSGRAGWIVFWCLASLIMLGLWQGSVYASLFMLAALMLAMNVSIWISGADAK